MSERHSEEKEALKLFEPSLRAPSPEIHRCPCCNTEFEFGEPITLDLSEFESLSEIEFAELVEWASTVRIVGTF